MGIVNNGVEENSYANDGVADDAAANDGYCGPWVLSAMRPRRVGPPTMALWTTVLPMMGPWKVGSLMIGPLKMRVGDDVRWQYDAAANGVYCQG